MREYVKVPLLHAHARMSLLVYLANAMPMDTTDRTMPMPARHQSRLASAMMSSPFYSIHYHIDRLAVPDCIATENSFHHETVLLQEYNQI